MSRHSNCALALLVAALVACEKGSDDSDAAAGEGGDAPGGSAGQGGTSGRGGTGAGVGGAVAGRSAQGGATSGRGGASTGGGAGAGSAGVPSGSGTSGAGGSGAEDGGRAGSVTLGGSGGRGGDAGSGGSSELGGAGGEPGSSCVNPLDTIDVSRLVASESFDPYVVTGSSANQIRQSINQNRGMDYDAYTGWYLSWQFGDCAGNGLVVTVEVTYTYPEWEPSASATSELVASWETYTDALFCHEYGHAKHGLDCANEVYTALSAIDTGGDCGEQQAEAEAVFDTIIDECNEVDVQYDADTNHGATMGAVFPP